MRAGRLSSHFGSTEKPEEIGKLPPKETWQHIGIQGVAAGRQPVV